MVAQVVLSLLSDSLSSSSTISTMKDPKIGEAYQAKIPPFISTYDCNYSQEIPNDTIETNNFYKYPNDTWNKIEEASLMLGLYIFGKNFAQLKRFIGSKSIGDIQTFYHTKFYMSEDHKRWKVYRKERMEKYTTIDGAIKRVYRQTLFTTPTHQYLLSCLLNNDSVECCKKLLQDFKNFKENKLSLEDYVITLKDLVGLEALINVVGIGKEDELSNLTAEALIEAVSHPELIKDVAAGNGSNESKDKGSTSGVSTNIANYLPEEKVEGDETMVNDVAEIKFDDHENQLSNRDVETSRKSKRLPKPSTKVLEAVVDKYEKEISCKSRRSVETLRKSRTPAKPSTKALVAVVDKYKEETSCKRTQDVETLRKSRRPRKPSTKVLEAIVDKFEETSCKRRREVETLRKSKRPHKPSTKVLEAAVDKFEETSCKRRRDVETLRKSKRPRKPSTKVLEATVDKFEETSCKRRRDVETLKKSSRPPKPSKKALEVVADKYKEETNCKRRREVETLRKSKRPRKPSTKVLEAAVDKFEETSCKRSRDGETLKKSSRPPKPSKKALEVVADKYKEETNCKRRQDVETSRKSGRTPKPSMKVLEAVVDKYEEEASSKRRRV